jgi:hypothetical protein
MLVVMSTGRWCLVVRRLVELVRIRVVQVLILIVAVPSAFFRQSTLLFRLLVVDSVAECLYQLV